MGCGRRKKEKKKKGRRHGNLLTRPLALSQGGGKKKKKAEWVRSQRFPDGSFRYSQKKEGGRLPSWTLSVTGGEKNGEKRIN